MFSLEPHEFATMVAACREAKAATSVHTPPDEPHRGLRRSLYAVKDIKAGEPFTKDNVRSIRPGNGLEPKLMNELLTRKAAMDLQAGTALHLGIVA